MGLNLVLLRNSLIINHPFFFYNAFVNLCILYRGGAKVFNVIYDD